MACENRIEVSYGNSETIKCTVSGLPDLVGYTGKLMVKLNLSDADADAKFEVDGVITALEIVFDVTAAQNTIPPGQYFYDVFIEKAPAFHTVVEAAEYAIKQTVKGV